MPEETYNTVTLVKRIMKLIFYIKKKAQSFKEKEMGKALYFILI